MSHKKQTKIMSASATQGGHKYIYR